MKHRDAIVETLHKLRERIGRAHGFDADRIAATIREHERAVGRSTASAAPQRMAPRAKTRGRAAQQRDGAVGA